MPRAKKATLRTTQKSKPVARSTAKPALTKSKAAALKSAPAKASERAAIVTKGELRTQIEKLEQAVATLRAKSREANRGAKASAARIAELESEVARLEKQVASQVAAAKRSASRSAARKSREIDPGDAVPPGVAVQEPGPLDEEAKEALGNLEEHLRKESEEVSSVEMEQEPAE